MWKFSFKCISEIFQMQECWVFESKKCRANDTMIIIFPENLSSKELQLTRENRRLYFPQHTLMHSAHLVAPVEVSRALSLVENERSGLYENATGNLTLYYSRSASLYSR